MKPHHRIFAFTLMALICSVTAFGVPRPGCSKEYIIGSPQGGLYAWNGFSDANCDCPNAGNNCFVRLICDNITITDGGAHWHVEGHLANRRATIQPNSTTSFGKDLSIGYYTFPMGSMSFGAGECGLTAGVSLSLAGVTTTSSGWFSANVAK